MCAPMKDEPSGRRDRAPRTSNSENIIWFFQTMAYFDNHCSGAVRHDESPLVRGQPESIPVGSLSCPSINIVESDNIVLTDILAALYFNHHAVG